MLTALAPFDGDTILPLADARVHLNLTADDDFHDAAVESARDGAIGWVESYSGRSLQAREFEWSADQFCSVIRLPIGPVSAVDGISYYDSEGTDTALVEGDWVSGRDRVVASGSWPYANGDPGGVRITFTAGYATAADIPTNLIAAVKLAMTAMFEDRSNPDLTAAMRCADAFRSVL